MEKIIQVSQIKKSYGAIEAVKGISFYVEKGKLFAFLGPNGAGKSTTIDMICTFLQPDEGTILVDGKKVGEDDDAIRRSIGVVFQDSLLDATLTVEENLYLRGGLYGYQREELKRLVEEAMEMALVKDFSKQLYGKLSGGQRRRCDIARALINRPQILILDEPTTGLDPQTRQAVWKTILDMQKKYDMTLFLTTHYMEEASGADYVMVVDQGKIVASGSPGELKEKYAVNKLIITTGETKKVAALIEEKGYTSTIVANQVEVPLGSTKESLALLDTCAPWIHSFEVLKGTMDDAFIGITGKELK